MPDAQHDALTPQRAPIVALALVALAALIAGLLTSALSSGGAVEQRITDREVAGIRAALLAQGPAAAAIGHADAFPGSRPLQAIAEGARSVAGGTVRIVDADGQLLLQTDSYTDTDSSAQTSAAFTTGRPASTVIGRGDTRRRLTTVPLRTSIGTIALVAFTPAREAAQADAVRAAIRRGALIGLAAGLLVLLAGGFYFRRKALIRSPKRS